MQHLRVLEEANLVLSRKEGRSRLSYSNPVPLRMMYERWVNDLASGAAETALQFKRYAESKEETKDLSEFRSVQIEIEIFVNASPQTCFDALTKNYNDWFPFRFKKGSTVYSDAHVGGTNGERFSDGGGAIHATVLYVDPPHLLTVGGAGAMLDGCNVLNSHKFIAKDGGTVLQRRMHLWGHVTEELESMLRDGTKPLFEKFFREYVESGVKFTEEPS
jgi:uncharacterized protein YndB with AHSA1/START domain